MNAVQEILSSIPVEQLASQVGSDPQTVQRLSAQLIPALIGGMSANADDPAGERSLATALNQHASSGLLSGNVDLDNVDTQDGEAIVHNVFGDNTNQVTQNLGQQVAGGNSELVQKLLKVLAPIVLAYLANRFLEGRTGGADQGGSGGILGDILDGLTGGSQRAPQQPAPGGGGLRDVLLDMLGGAFGGGGAGPAPAPQTPQTQTPQAPGQRTPGQQFEPPRTVPGGINAPAEIPIDDSAPAPQSRSQQPSSGGDLLGDILGGLLGRGRRS